MYSIVFKDADSTWWAPLPGDAFLGKYLTLPEARAAFSRLRLTLGADIAAGDELKCQVEINGKKFNIYIAGLMGAPIKYTDFTECL